MKFFTTTLFVLFLFNIKSQTLTWTGTAGDGVFTNSLNWSPQQTPTSTNDVVFPLAMATTIIPNGGACQNLTSSTTNPINFNNTGGDLSIAGSLIANGNLTFNSTIVNFIGTGTIDVGTSASRFTTAQINIDCGTGTYTLANNLTMATTGSQTNSRLTFTSGSFVSSGYIIESGYIIYGVASSPRTVNLSNSLVTCKYQFEIAARYTVAANNTYINAGTRLVFDGSVGGYLDYGYGVTGINIDFQSITFNRPTAVPGSSAIRGAGLIARHGTITTDSLILNTPNFSFSTSYQSSGFGLVVNNMMELQQHCQIVSSIFYGVDFTVNAINFPAAGCTRSSLTTRGVTNLNFMATSPIITGGNMDFYNINFSGSTVTAAPETDLGLNSGTVSFTSPSITGSAYFWIGNGDDWHTAANWSLTSGGISNPGGCIPTSLDDVVFDVNSFSSSGEIVTINQAAFCRNITFTDPSNEGVLQGSGLLSNSLYVNIHGNADITGANDIRVNLN